MPIKLPKGFPRRKSSGNALEEVHNPPQPPQPSFRVFERPTSGSKSFDGGHHLRRMSQGRPLSEGRSFEDGRPSPVANLANRGSGGTQNSSSSGGLYDTSSSSARFSSSSTLPSSSSIENYTDDSAHAHPKPSKPLPNLPLPVAKPGFFQRASERTFSMGRKAAQTEPAVEAVHVPQISRNAVSTPQPNAYYNNLPDLGRITRPRAMTETSGSTATPPKLLDTDLDFGGSGDMDFGNMFEGFDSDRKRISKSPENLGPIDARNGMSQPGSELAPNPYLTNRSPYTPPPPPLNAVHNKQVLASPYSNDSRTSLDGLMAPSPWEEQGTFEKSEPSYKQRFLPFRNTPSPVVSSPTTESRQQLLGSTLRRDSTYDEYRKSTPIEDTDALLVNGSASASRKADARSKPCQKDQPSVSRKPISKRQAPGPRTDSLSPSNQSTPRPQQPDVSLNDDTLLHDQSFREMAKSAERFQSGKGSPPKPSKVMTPAQFELYRKQQELSRSRSNASKSEDSDEGDRYSDDDEERQKQLVKQRRKQEAHLAVYRQQMMKVTGEQPSKLDSRPGLDRHSMSTPNLTTRKSNLSLRADVPATNGKNSDDEDEDIPLGILAAHGFPSKDRRPTELGRSITNIQYTSESYPPPPASVAGSVAGGGPRGALPPFARNLPKDPYYGASIVNPANRESLAFGSGGGSVYGGSQSPSTHPGGLVGVIASEERARAMRRGSPNAQGGYGLPGTGLPLPPSMSPPSILSPGDQAQMQMAQQMSQMMQMQAQWMQQMQQMQQMVNMQGMQPGQAQPQMPPMLQMPMMQPGFMSPPSGSLQVPQIQMQRPMSMGGQPPQFGQPSPQQQQQRAMSMLNPDMASQWNQNPGSRMSVGPSVMMSGAIGPGPGYVPSIAPSERSNVGQPSRYRPVSIAPADEAPRNKSRASTMSGATALKAWDSNGNRKSGGLEVPRQSGRAVKKESDDDDDEGWEEMKRKREEKKMLKGKKSTDKLGPLGDIFYPGT